MSIETLNKKITRCNRCPRLRDWCEEVAVTKRAAYRDETYWGKPVTGFGDVKARLLIIGLAPGAHGANRTGRMFTGDRSGEWLYRALYKAGLANQAASLSRDDGLELINAFVTGIVRCAPPLNKPTTEERNNCLPWLEGEFDLLPHLNTLITLGSFAWTGTLRFLADRGYTLKPKPKFGHMAQCEVGPYHIIGSYHPSQQNTFTGKLTQPMFQAVFSKAVETAKRT